MADTCIEGMSLTELDAHITAARERYVQLLAAQADTDAARRQRIGAVVAELTATLGPADPTTPGTDSIRAMLLYPDADLQQHAGLALRLVLIGLEIVTRASRDLALVVGDEV